jgi:predicted amidohydrolase YtcJ
VLSHDIFALPLDRLREARVALTLCNGKIVYRAEDVLS